MIIRRSALILAVALILATPLLASETKEAVTAPVPEQIPTAKKVFVSNAGTDTPYPDFFGHDPNYAYARFYAGVQRWGRLELAPTPSDADLVFQIGVSFSFTGSEHSYSELKVNRYFDTKVRLVILDPKTHVVLWTSIERVPNAVLQRNRDKNLDDALTRLLKDLEAIVAQPATSTHAPAK